MESPTDRFDELAACSFFRFVPLLARFTDFTGLICEGFSGALIGEDMSWASNFVDAFFAACLGARVLMEDPVDIKTAI